MSLNIQGVSAYEFRPPPRKIYKAARRDLRKLKWWDRALSLLIAAWFVASFFVAIRVFDDMFAVSRATSLGVFFVGVFVLMGLKIWLNQHRVTTNFIQQKIINGGYREHYTKEGDYSYKVITSDFGVLQFHDKDIATFLKRASKTEYDRIIRELSRVETAVSAVMVRDAQIHTLNLAGVIFGDEPALDDRRAEVHAEVLDKLPDIKRRNIEEMNAIANLARHS